MANSDQTIESKDTSIKSKIGLIASWFFGIILIMAGAGMLIESTIAGLLVFVAGLLLIPTINNVIKEKVNINLSGSVRAVIAFTLFIIGAAILPPTETTSDSNDFVKTQVEQSNIQIPEYSVLQKTEHISTRMSDDRASYFGGVLIEESVADISPDDFAEIARVIAERENLDNSASFYSTEDAYRADYTLYVPEENRVQIEHLGGLESNQKYKPQQEIDRLLDEGYIGRFEDGEFTMSPSSAYYELHHGDSDAENGVSSKNQTESGNNEKPPLLFKEQYEVSLNNSEKVS